MKRVIAITILILMVAILCGYTKAEADNHKLWILDRGSSYLIYVDTRTGVQYLRTQSGVCVMVNADGNPLMWEGAK